MDEFGTLFAKKGEKRAIRHSYLRFFGKSVNGNSGNKSVFDRRGAIMIKKGEKGISDAGGGYTPADPIALYRPAGGKFVSQQKAMDSHFGWVYAFVKAISDEVAGIDFRLFEITGKGEHEEVLEHEMLDILDGVNEYQTGPEFKKTLASHLELTGNAYLYLLGVKDFNSKPKAIYLLNPGQTKVFINKTTFPYKIDHYVMIDDNREFRFEPYEIVHIKYPDPNDPFMGVGTVEGIAEWIDNDNYATEFNRNFFRNGARMSGVFETDFATIEQGQRLKISFEEQFAGVKNAYKTMIMPKGVKFVPSQMNAKDMDFNKGLDTSRDRILAGSRVSKTILGTAESDTNRSTAETADYVFAKRTIKPKMIQIIAYLNEFLVPRFGENLYLSFDDPVPEDKAARNTEMQTAVGQKQVITQNEARELYMGLGPIDDDPEADKINGTPAADPIDPDADDEPEPNKKPKKDDDDDDSDKALSRRKNVMRPFIKYAISGKSRKSVKTQFSRNAAVRQSLSSGIAKELAAYLTKTKKKTVVGMTDEEYLSVVYVHSKARIDEYEAKIFKTMSSISKRQEAVVLENLDDALPKSKLFSKKASVNQGKLFNLKEWIGITLAEIEPLAMMMFKDEFKTAAENAGTPEAQISAHIAEALKERMTLLGRSYNETVMEALTQKLDEGISNGFSREQLAQSVKDIYAWAQDYQAERVAKTETVAISNMANKSAWQAGGRVQTVKWFTSQKDNVCPFCREMAGTEIDINANFIELGGEFTGDDGKVMTANYTSISGPPLHPNCGCLLRPSSWKVDTSVEQTGDKGSKKDDDTIDATTAAIKELKKIEYEK